MTVSETRMGRLRHTKFRTVPICMLFMTVVVAAVFGAKLFVFLAWLLSLPVLLIWDIIVGFVQGVHNR